MPSLSVNVYDKYGTARQSLTSIQWAWFDADPALGTSSNENGTAESTDASGLMDITLTNTALAAGQEGYLLLYHVANNYVGYYKLQVQP